MGRLLDDRFLRRPATRPTRGGAGVVSFALIAVSLALLLLSRLDHSIVRQLRIQALEGLAQALGALVTPFGPVRRASREMVAQMSLAEDNARLKAENQRLMGWEGRARELERQVASLSALARVVEPRAPTFITSRVVADAAGPFARASILPVGRQQGVKAGHPVIDADGLVGRVVESGRQAARVLLLTDVSSRIPVLVGSQGLRAVLVGDGGSRPRLTLLPPKAVIAPGDEVVTSGVGGVFPRGLRIGRAAGSADGAPVDAYARLDDLEYVSVLLLDAPSLEDSENDGQAAVDARSRRAVARSGTAGQP